MNEPEKTFSRLLNENLKQEESIRQKKEEDASAPGIVPRQTHIDKTDKLYEQCQALESFLVKNILTAMRKNIMKSSLIDTGFAGEIYEDMLWDEYAKDYTKNAGFGLADLAYLELTGQRGRKV
jgi:flagellar protein FlgJ